MIADSVKFKGYSCFKEEWAGFETIKPVNVIIGRNNSGKSRLLQLVEDLCSGKIYRSGSNHLCTATLNRSNAIQVFKPGNSGGRLPAIIGTTAAFDSKKKLLSGKYPAESSRE